MRTVHTTVAAAAMALALVAPRSAAAGQQGDEALTVRIKPTIVLEAQDVKALVIVPRRPEHRRLVVTLEAQSYYASTERQLDGDAAARMHEFSFRQLPVGEYLVRVSVEGVREVDEEDVEMKFTVRGAPEDVPAPPAGQ